MAATKKAKDAKVAAGLLKTPEAETFADAADKIEFKGIIPRDGVGRPTVVTGAALPKLEYAFKIGCTDSEAALYAGISARALYRHFEKHPEYRQQTKEWKDDYLVMFARSNVAAAITGQTPKGSVTISQDYLRAKRKDEFAEKGIVEHQAALTPSEIEERASREFQGRRGSVIEGEVVPKDDHSPAIPHSEEDAED